jgi:uncharacterized protein (DUF1330 family)
MNLTDSSKDNVGLHGIRRGPNRWPRISLYICEEVIDREKLAEYFREVVTTVEGFGIKYDAVYTPFVQLEGEPVRGVVLARFDSTERALAWYNSEAYTIVRQLRLEGARGTVLVVEDGAVAPELRLI